MSTPEQRGPEPVIEQKTRIKISENAKGEPRFDVTIVEGADADEVQRIRTLAITTYQELGKALVVAGPGRPGPAGAALAAATAAGADEPGPAS